MADDLPTATPRLLDSALWYAAQRGWRVFPLHNLKASGACTCGERDCSKGKHPRTPNGCNDASTDPAQIRAWWKRWPLANVGIATGRGLVVLDVDPRNDGAESLSDLLTSLGQLPDTVEVLTGGGGRHIYLSAVDTTAGKVFEVRNSASVLGRGVDVRGDGGYVVAPPSSHQSGQPYRWEASSRPEEKPVAPCPPAWLRALTDRPKLRALPGGKGEPFPEGQRNDSLYRRGCSMRSAGFDLAAIEAALHRENETRCVPTLDPVEVRKIAESCARLPEGLSPGYQAKREEAEGRRARRAPRAEQSAPAPMEGDRTEANDPTEAPSLRREIFDRGDSIEIAERLLRDLRSDSSHPIVSDRGALWRYDDPRGVFVRLEHAAVYRVVGAYAGLPKLTKGGIRGLALSDAAIHAAISAAGNLADRAGFFNDAPAGVCFANGWVTARGGKVEQRPHSPEHRAIHALPVEYESDAPRGAWTAMLREVFRRETVDEEGNVTGYDDQETERAIELLQEFAGAALLGFATEYAVCLVLVGPGNDGKSRVLNVLRSLFPQTAVCSVAPHLWARGFLLAELAGRRLNVVSELPDGDLQDSERFKAVVGGDVVTAERKYGDPFSLVPVAGHIFACNELPGTRDQSRGFWRRFVVIPCTRSFLATEERKNIDREVIASDLAGIAAWAIEGAARLQRAGQYTTPKTSADAKSDWQRGSDQVRQWVEAGCVEVPKDAPRPMKSVLASLYTEYRPWAIASGHQPLSIGKLGARLKALGYEHRTKIARLYLLRLKGAGKGAGKGVANG